MSTFALRPLDYAIVAAYLALIVAMGIYFGRKAKRSMLDYFLSHRSMPWWLAGTAMVATTFSADTPLAVTRWSSRTAWPELAVVVDARLGHAHRLLLRAPVAPRRSGDGRRADRASLLRQARRVPPRFPRRLPRPASPTSSSWAGSTSAWPKCSQGTLGISNRSALFACLIIVFAYTVYSGYWGVATTHGVQYLFEMGGAIILAVVALERGRRRQRAESEAGVRASRRDAAGHDVRHLGGGDVVLAERRRRLGRADDHARRAARPELVGVVVSRLGAGRRRLRRAEHAGLPRRARGPQRGALLQHRALRAAQLAVGDHGALHAGDVRRRGEGRRSRHQLRAGDGRSSADRSARD